MAEPEPESLAGVPARLRKTLSRCAARLPPNVALMLLLSECTEPKEAEDALVAAIGELQRRGDGPGARRIDAALDLLRSNPQAFEVVRSVLSRLDHRHSPAEAAGATSYWAAAFDDLAGSDPEAGVALYALGNPELLSAATQEVADKLAEWGVLSPDAKCLDLGCGIGRLAQALAPKVGHIVGLDISQAMVETARCRLAGVANVEVRRTDGGDLAGLEDESFDLVLAVDSFPYIVQSGPNLTERMLAECVRVLRPGGHLVILNFSYRGDLEHDREELRAVAKRKGLKILRDGAPEFSLWDGTAFQLQRGQ